MRMGARDVVSLSATDRVQAVMSRELRTFRLERALNTTLQSASDYRRQLQSVLQRSNDAILQVQEGIVVDANQTWLELFGYADAGVVVGQPLMDLFEDRSHAALKGALVACAPGQVDRPPAQSDRAARRRHAAAARPGADAGRIRKRTLRAHHGARAESATIAS